MAGPVLRVELALRQFEALELPEPLDPSSWRLVKKSDGSRVAVKFAKTVLLEQLGATCFVSVAQDARDGQHVFVNLNEALEMLKTMEPRSRQLQEYPEHLVKGVQDATLLYARAQPRQASGPPSDAGSLWDYPELAPRGRMSNYSIVPWCCTGRTEALILVDEATLTRSLPEEKILDHVSLVVNCHEDQPNVAKYTCGKATGAPLTVVAHAVHRWYSVAGTNSTIAKNMAIQEAIWDHMSTKKGSVAVHCLAGIHRAACIVVCHFLYRHYVLGHANIPNDPEDIYRKLKSVRPLVSPAYLDILQTFEDHCKHIAKSRR